jgi:DNA processing protein
VADARWLVEGLVAAGLVVTSGLALGIDGAAHAAALDAGGVTIAVLGTGIDRIYPSRHRPLATRIAQSGLLLSEFLPGTPPLPHHFPRRNRLISGLALGVLVVEAGEHSGSMISARLAASQGRDVFAVPGTMRDPNAAGCHRLVREGAVLVRSAADVLEELGWEGAADPGIGSGAPVSNAAAAEPGPQRDACPVLAAIDPLGTSFDLVLARSGLDAGTLAVRLTELELAGLISREMDRLVRLS